MSGYDPDFKNPNREPVIALRDLAMLNDAEVLEGHQDGRAGLPCGDNRSRSYWHGHRTGSRDGGYREGDFWDSQLAANVCPRGTGIMTLPARIEEMRAFLRLIGQHP